MKGTFLLRASAPWRVARRLLILASFLAIVLLATPAWAGEPCCAVTAIDARAGMVTAREAATGRTFQFKVSDAALLKSLKVGQKISADFKAMTVTLTAAGLGGKSVQVPIYKPEPQGSSPSKSGYDIKKNKKT